LAHSLSILVLSCDKYSDIWRPFFQFLEKYWSDCPYTIYLGTNTKQFRTNGVIQLFSNEVSNWSDETKKIVSQIPEDYVLIILEDYFINGKVNTKEIEQLFQVMQTEYAGYLKLAAFPKKYNELWPYGVLTTHPHLGAIEKGARYRVCLQTAIWNKQTLLELLRSGESPWEFEIKASERSVERPEQFLTVVPKPGVKIVHGPVPYYCTALSAGKWMRGAIELCKKEGITIDLSARSAETYREELFRRAYIGLPIAVRKIVDFFNSKISKLR
jgi:hypothetical protein